MTIQQLRYVLTIAEMGSLSKAAEVLYIAQPSLTTSVQELEKELGITLFYRTGRGVTLTNDRATMLNLMVGLLGYTLCSGIICEELNGSLMLWKSFRSLPMWPTSRAW